MKILVLNSGSSSLKYKLYDMTTISVITHGMIESITDGGHHDAILEVEGRLGEIGIESLACLDGIGHRVVHGGEEFTSSVIVDDSVISTIRSLIPLAPLHNPANLEGVLIALDRAPEVRQVAVFDTAFHQTIPKHAYMYALPYELYEHSGIRRYGFHGTSHHFVAKQAAIELHQELSQTNLITLHLGNGASVCAIQGGISIDTSMGFTPLEGLMMGSRSGDIDPAITLYMAREMDYTTAQIDNILNKQSGLLGISGVSDMRQIHQLIADGDSRAILAHQMFCYRICKYIGSYSAILGRVDAIVFTGGIGEHDSITRDTITQMLSTSTPHLTIPTNEELEIALQTVGLLGG